MKENFIGIGERIKFTLNSKRLKQIDVCKKANISKNAISNYISGNRVPDTASLFKLSKFLDVSMEWLLTGKSSSPSLPLEHAVNPPNNDYAICEHINSNNCDENSPTDNVIVLSKDEHDLINKYREISMNDREEVSAILNMKYARIGLKKGRSSTSANVEDGEDAATKELA